MLVRSIIQNHSKHAQPKHNSKKYGDLELQYKLLIKIRKTLLSICMHIFLFYVMQSYRHAKLSSCTVCRSVGRSVRPPVRQPTCQSGRQTANHPASHPVCLSVSLPACITLYYSCLDLNLEIYGTCRVIKFLKLVGCGFYAPYSLQLFQ